MTAFSKRVIGCSALVSVFFGLSLSLATQVKAQSREVTQMDEQGWTYVVEQNPRSLLAHIQVIVRSGGLSDPENLPGLANFTARALLRGTKTRPLKDLMDSIERLGASVSVSVDQDRTVIAATVIAKNLDRFLDLLRDILTQPAFDAREMVTLQGILQGEIKTALQDTQVLAGRALLKTAYRGTGVEKSAMGTVTAISRMTPADAFGFYVGRYVRENIIIGISSPLAVEETKTLFSSKLDSTPRGRVDGPVLPAPTVRGRHAVIVNRKGMSTVPLYIAVPGIGDGDSDLPALEVGNFVFGADFTSRLMQVLRAENGWTYGASSSYRQLIRAKREPSLFSIYTFPSVEHAGLAIPKAFAMLGEYVEQGVSEVEFSDAREALKNRYAFELDTTEKRLAHRLREILNGRRFESTDQYRKRLDALDHGTLNSILNRRMSTRDAVIAVVGDPAVLKPILAGLPGIETVEVIDVQP